MREPTVAVPPSSYRAYLADEMQDADEDAIYCAEGIAVRDLVTETCQKCGDPHEFAEIVNQNGRRLGLLRVTVNDEEQP